jgi:hypothetical protein
MGGLRGGRKERIGSEETRVQSGFRVERKCEIGRRKEEKNRTVNGLPRFKDRDKTEILQVVLGFLGDF